MKKEYWLYLVIAILVVWIIASYIKGPDDVEDTNKLIDEELASEEKDLSEIGMPVLGLEGEGVVETVVEGVPAINAPAGENKGNIASVGIPNVAKVVVTDQSAGNMVAIGAVDMPVNGWVVVHEDRAGVPGNILGAQRFDAGSYVGGQVELMRGTVSGGRYYVMIHADDGDKQFDHKLDMPLVSGGVTMTTFVAR